MLIITYHLLLLGSSFLSHLNVLKILIVINLSVSILTDLKKWFASIMCLFKYFLTSLLELTKALKIYKFIYRFGIIFFNCYILTLIFYPVFFFLLIIIYFIYFIIKLTNNCFMRYNETALYRER